MSADPWAAWRAFSPGPSGVAPGVATPQDFVEQFNRAARTFLGTTGAANPAEAARGFADALRDAFAAGQAPATPGVGAAAPQAPAFGLTREHQLRWQRLGEAARQAEEAQRRLQRLWADALREAGTTYSAGLTQDAAAAAATDDPAAAMRRLYDRWIDCAEDAYSRVAHGTAFCEALADAVNAGSRWRHELKALAEESSRLLDLPTRSEINALQERLRAVEAELRDARRPATATAAPRKPRAARPRTP